MIVDVDAQIIISHPSQRMLNYCQKDLVIPNPEYSKKVRMNLWLGDTPKVLQLYETDGDKLLLPYGCLSSVFEIADADDALYTSLPIARVADFHCEIPLFDYQAKAVKIVLNHMNGILKAPAGSGKTQMGLAIASQLKRKTLWLTHTVDLMNQSKERAEKYMPKDLIGTITNGKVNIGEVITFATIQTMSSLDLSKYKYTWDTIIVDECHRVAGTPTSVTMFSKVLNNLGARHKYGLSATVHRADGLIKATFSLLGEVICEVSEDEVADKILRVSIKPRATDVPVVYEILNTDGTINYPRYIDYLCRQESRNQLILKDLISNSKHSNLILSDRIAHLEMLMNMLPDELRKKAVMITGKQTNKAERMARNQALEDMRAGRKKYLFASYPLAKEGLDIPRLDRLYLTTPQRDYATVTQSVGRVARTHWDKTDALVYDYVDVKIPYSLKSFKKRSTTYRNLKARILDE